MLPSLLKVASQVRNDLPLCTDNLRRASEQEDHDDDPASDGHIADNWF